MAHAVDVLRWVATLPASVVTWFVTHGVTYWVLTIIDQFHPYEPSPNRMRVLAGGVATFAAIYAVAYVAPRFKREAAIVATAFTVLAAAFGVVASIYNIVSKAETNESPWFMAFYSAALGVGAVVGCLKASDEWGDRIPAAVPARTTEE